MRIVLKKGKQKELIESAKEGMSWDKLANEINHNSIYLLHELRNEKRYLSEEVYSKLCRIAKVNFDNFIIKKLDDNWGRSKGGKNSLGSTIILPKIKFNENLAEFVGAVLGDGNICYYKKGKKTGVYQVKIAGDYNLDKDYHMSYLKKLCFDLFGLEGKEIIVKDKHERFICFSSKKLVESLINEGLKSGDKIKNQITIPNWIFKNNEYLRACIRGLIDTDGCIHRMSNQDPNLLRINFKNYNKTLLEDARKAFVQLGFSPSKIIINKAFSLSRQKEISKYLKEIGFSNKKHIDRFRKFSLVV
ncbi:hypothetical protein COS75_01195 [Candidatus Pacearchaeota archaeon CG06_land_8_20_14_3_00_35_12]|nr:MAG: hypothetical protein COS75_01195 [Candidatus Pacearchaeota archaeon CG06_land_8_20_14_3_00_35_12]